ncbi:MAG: hypothetical protein WCL02_05570 [bacterium]
MGLFFIISLFMYGRILIESSHHIDVNIQSTVVSAKASFISFALNLGFLYKKSASIFAVGNSFILNQSDFKIDIQFSYTRGKQLGHHRDGEIIAIVSHILSLLDLIIN